MTTIRPTPPPVPARQTGAAAPVQAAQRAFFQAALDGARSNGARPEPEPARRVAPQPTDRLPRPGSLLDIRV